MDFDKAGRKEEEGGGGRKEGEGKGKRVEKDEEEEEEDGVEEWKGEIGRWVFEAINRL